MSDPLPRGFSTYRSVPQDDPSKELNTGRNKDLEDDEGCATFFNQQFESIKEIQQDGEVLGVMKNSSSFKRMGANKRKFGEYSLLLRQIVDTKINFRPRTQLEIQSLSLRQAFATIAQNFTSIRRAQDPIIISEPYIEIYHCSKMIEDQFTKSTDSNLKSELKLLLDFKETYMRDTINTIKGIESDRRIEYEWLWAIFPPGELVIIENNSATTAPIYWCTVLKTFEFQKNEAGMPTWCITVRHTGYNGVKFGSAETKYIFSAFSDNMPVNHLPAYPLRFCDSQEIVRENAICRGNLYEAYCLASSKSSGNSMGTPKWHNGPIWTQRDPDSSDRRGCRIIDRPRRTVTGRVIVDFEGFYEHAPNFRENLRSPNAEQESEDESDSDHWGRERRMRMRRRSSDRSSLQSAMHRTIPLLSDDEKLTCSPFVPSFSFTTRQWCYVLLDDLKGIEWRPEVFDQLQVNKNLKETIQGLVRGYASNSGTFEDFVDGKGGGLIFLLHGDPGTGKTMTAESTSELLRKPLYHLSGGELGASADSIESALEKAFYLAKRWDAILLLDEADTFLTKRDGVNIERNSLVAG
ncbi:AAA family ATPase [Colletotrichum cuscutae]|uniref:AAA family ATPase n=1 Tax=Colletotrichum cuscutae TaxID=1209917 RepID=A0AAJ0DL24_9PEZI|nr:AAA family ATPase [Colletotrichum cuscutae]